MEEEDRKINGKECLQILRDIKDVAFATVGKKGMPQVRIIDVMMVEDKKLYFCTARGKEFYSELLSSPYVSITGMNDAYQMVRLMGKVNKLKDEKYWIDRFIDENPTLSNVYPNDSRYILEPFCVEEGQIELFDLGKEPIYRKTFTLEKGQIREKGFEITDDCVQCGICKKVCPQQCIEEGEPYQIKQAHCLHCGLCFEECPVEVIERK